MTYDLTLSVAVKSCVNVVVNVVADVAAVDVAAVESCVVDVISAGKVSSDLKSICNNFVVEGKMFLM